MVVYSQDIGYSYVDICVQRRAESGKVYGHITLPGEGTYSQPLVVWAGSPEPLGLHNYAYINIQYSWVHLSKVDLRRRILKENNEIPPTATSGIMYVCRPWFHCLRNSNN